MKIPASTEHNDRKEIQATNPHYQTNPISICIGDLEAERHSWQNTEKIDNESIKISYSADGSPSLQIKNTIARENSEKISTSNFGEENEIGNPWTMSPETNSSLEMSSASFRTNFRLKLKGGSSIIFLSQLNNILGQRTTPKEAKYIDILIEDSQCGTETPTHLTRTEMNKQEDYGLTPLTHSSSSRSIKNEFDSVETIDVANRKSTFFNECSLIALPNTSLPEASVSKTVPTNGHEERDNRDNNLDSWTAENQDFLPQQGVHTISKAFSQPIYGVDIKQAKLEKKSFRSLGSIDKDMLKLEIWQIKEKTNMQELDVSESSDSHCHESQQHGARGYDHEGSLDNVSGQTPIRLSLSEAEVLERKQAIYPNLEDRWSDPKDIIQIMKSGNAIFYSTSSDFKSSKGGILTGIIQSTPDLLNTGSFISRIMPKKVTNTTESADDQTSIPDETFFWEKEMIKLTGRRRACNKHKEKWNLQTIPRIQKKMAKVGNVMDTKSYYSAFRHNRGRTNPFKELVLSLIWTTMFLCLHKNYLDWGTKYLGLPIDPWFSYSSFNYFCIALGFLLYMQADASSARWWEARVQWQNIMENSKRLVVLLNTHLNCLRLSSYGTQLILGHTICIRNLMQNKFDKVWVDELSVVLKKKEVKCLMKHPRRLRSFALLYGFQRMICLCITHKILPKEVIRDINPLIVTMSNSLGACNRIRITKLPWVIAVHLQFILIIYIAVLPMTLVGVQKQAEWDFVVLTKIDWVDIYIYEIIIAYAFFGLARMALDIDDPFSFSRENHSFGFWGFYKYWSLEELKNLLAIFGFRAREHGKNGINASGDYGDRWVHEKLELPLNRAINDDNLPKTNNLFGRTEEIRNQLILNRRTTSFWAKFNMENDDESSILTFASSSESWDDEEPYICKNGLFEDLKTERRKSFAERLSGYKVRFPRFS